MRVLVISSMFPCRRHPVSAVFFANLLKEFSEIAEEVIVVSPRIYIPGFLKKFKKDWEKWDLDPMVSRMGKIRIIRPHIPQMRGEARNGANGILMGRFLYYLISRIATAKKIQMILGYNMLPEGVAAIRLARALKLPGGFWAIGSDVNDYARASRLNYRLAKESLAESNIVFTESRDLENSVREIAGKPVNVLTFYKGIDVSNFLCLPEKNELREKLGLAHDKKYILFAGRLIKEKGIYELAHAFSAIRKKHREFNLILAGEELEKPGLLAALGKNGISGKAVFTGILSHRDLAGYMKASDLFVFPTWAEGLPNAVMEAMACGLPVVTTCAGGIPEIVQDGMTGLMAPVKDVEKLTLAVSRMIEDHGLREICVKNAKALIMRDFDVRKNVFRLQGMLEKLVARGPGYCP